MAENLYSLSDDLRNEQREQQEDMRLQLANQIQHNPDRSRRILSVSAVTGLPSEVVDADLENLEKLAVQQDFDVDKWRKESPGWASFASENPYHLSVLKDDQENMGVFERAFEQIGLGWDATWATVELGKLRSRQMDGDIREGDEERLKELQQYQVSHEFGAESWFGKFLVKNAKMVGPIIYSVGRGLELGLAGASVGAVAGTAAGPGAPVTVPGLALTGFGVGMTTGLMQSTFELERGFAYDEYLEMGLDHETAKIAANAVGAVNMVLESFGISKALKYIPGADKITGAIGSKLVGDVLAKPTMQRASAVAVARFGEVLGTEVVTEVLQESVTAVTGEIVRPEGVQPMTWDSYTERITDVALEVMQGAFLISSIGPGGSYYTDSRRAFQAKRMETVYKALGESAKDSSTRSSLPTKYREFVDRLTENGELKSLLIDVDRFTEYFQEIGQDPDQVAKELGIDLEEARATGTDIEIPIGVYAEKIAPTEHHAALVADLKASEDQMSAREAELWLANADELQKALANEEAPAGHKPVQEIHDAVLGDLLAAGMEFTAAEKQATLQEYVFSTLAERNAMAAVDLFKQYWGGVQKEIPEAFRKALEDVDVIVDPLLDRLRAGDIPTDRQAQGPSLIDFLVKRGGLSDVEHEMDVRDAGKARRGLVQAGGDSLEGAAEVAAEQGYIAEADPDLLIEAIDSELFGEPVFAPGFIQRDVQDLQFALMELAEFFEAEGIDLDEMSNAEVRKRLEGERTLDQGDRDEILETAIAAAVQDPAKLDAALKLFPTVAEEQDFADIAFTDKVSVTGIGETVEVKRPAQKIFDQAVRRRSNIKQLLDCVNG